MMHFPLLFTLLFSATFLNLTGQTHSGDTIQNIECGTKSVPLEIKTSYSGIVTYKTSPVPKIEVKICQPFDTTVVTTDANGIFATILSIKTDKLNRTYPKIIIQNAAYDRFEFQITEMHLDTISSNHKLNIPLSKSRK